MKAALPKFSKFVLCSAAALTILAGCAAPIDKEKLGEHSEFWQLRDTTSAIHVRGPKAQQMLNRDITRCVVSVRELNRLGALRHAFPEEIPWDPSQPQSDLETYDTPERTGYLRSEHFPFVDFETCMAHKGWERLEHVQYDVAKESRENYIETIIGEQYNTLYNSSGKREPINEEDFQGLNE